MPSKNKGLIPHPDNPFKDAIELAQGKIQTHTKSYINDEGDEMYTVAIIRKRDRGFSMLEQRRELLDLIPSACKVLVYIAIVIEYNAQQVRIHNEDVGMSRNTLTEALLDLIAHGVISKAEKPHMFWVNVTLILSGKLSK